MSLITATPPVGSRARSSMDRSAARRSGAPRLRVVRDEHRAAEVALLRRALRSESVYRSQLSSRSTSVYPLVSAPGRSRSQPEPARPQARTTPDRQPGARPQTERQQTERQQAARTQGARPPAVARTAAARKAAARPESARARSARVSSARAHSARPQSARVSAAGTRARRSEAAAPVRLTRRGRLVVRVGGAGLVLLALTAGVLLLDRPAQAGSTPQSVPVSYRVVLPGETLWQIAGEVAPTVDRRDTVARIAELNALSTTGVAAGQRIAVPVQTR